MNSQLQAINQLRKAATDVGLHITDLAKAAGYHGNLIHTWTYHAKHRNGKAYSDHAMEKMWNVIRKRSATLHPAVMPTALSFLHEQREAATPVKSDGNGTLRTLITDKLQGMSTVQLAMLYAHIVGEDG